MDQDAKARIMSAGAAKNGGQTQKGSWEARAQVYAHNNAIYVNDIINNVFFLHK